MNHPSPFDTRYRRPNKKTAEAGDVPEKQAGMDRALLFFAGTLLLLACMVALALVFVA